MAKNKFRTEESTFTKSEQGRQHSEVPAAKPAMDNSTVINEIHSIKKLTFSLKPQSEQYINFGGKVDVQQYKM